MRKIPRLLSVACLAATVAAGTAACGSSAPSASSASTPTPSASPQSGLTADQLATRALANTKNAPQVRLTGTGTDSGQTLALDLTLVRGKGCTGTISLLNKGSFKLLYDGKTVWVLPDAKFYKSVGVTDAGVLGILNGKYLKLKSTDSGLGGMATLCSLTGLIGAFGTPVGLSKGAPTTVGGVPAVKLSDNGDNAFIVVSDTAKPELLQLNAPGSSGGVFAFSYPTAVVTITPPPAGEVIDGSKYGF